jgi:hypothetical protein
MMVLGNNMDLHKSSEAALSASTWIVNHVPFGINQCKCIQIGRSLPRMRATFHGLMILSHVSVKTSIRLSLGTLQSENNSPNLQLMQKVKMNVKPSYAAYDCPTKRLQAASVE